MLWSLCQVLMATAWPMKHCAGARQGKSMAESLFCLENYMLWSLCQLSMATAWPMKHCAGARQGKSMAKLLFCLESFIGREKVQQYSLYNPWIDFWRRKQIFEINFNSCWSLCLTSSHKCVSHFCTFPGKQSTLHLLRGGEKHHNKILKKQSQIIYNIGNLTGNVC